MCVECKGKMSEHTTKTPEGVEYKYWKCIECGEEIAYKIDKVGKTKYEAYTRHRAHGKSRKIIFVVYPTEIFIITGAEGT